MAFAKFIMNAVFAYAVVLVLYVLLWWGVVSGFIPLSFSPYSSSLNFSSSTGSNQPLAFSASAEMVVWRFGFLPVYWSLMGDLTVHHMAWFSLSTVMLAAALGLKYRRLTVYPKLKFIKPKTGIPIRGEKQMPKPEKKSKPRSQAILTFWASIGFAWFIVYQLLPLIPYDASLVIVEFLNLSMWILALASAAIILHPRLKVLYYKIWEGGEKHE